MQEYLRRGVFQRPRLGNRLTLPIGYCFPMIGNGRARLALEEFDSQDLARRRRRLPRTTRDGLERVLLRPKASKEVSNKTCASWHRYPSRAQSILPSHAGFALTAQQLPPEQDWARFSRCAVRLHTFKFPTRRGCPSSVHISMSWRWVGGGRAGAASASSSSALTVRKTSE